jgi:hypothetical protein
VSAGSDVAARADALGAEAEAARTAALARLGEPAEVAGEPPIELFFVDARDDMRRLMGRPIGGFAQPRELTAAFVAGPGYAPFLRHEITHAYASVRWGELRAGEWLTEGLAALAQGRCQGHEVDALAARYVAGGAVPPLPELVARFRDVPELPGYLASASVVDFVRRREGIGAVRALWRTARPAGEHPLGPDGAATEAAWRRHLAGVRPAALDSVRLLREGCPAA